MRVQPIPEANLYGRYDESFHTLSRWSDFFSTKWKKHKALKWNETENITFHEPFLSIQLRDYRRENKFIFMTRTQIWELYVICLKTDYYSFPWRHVWQLKYKLENITQTSIYFQNTVNKYIVKLGNDTLPQKWLSCNLSTVFLCL
jgi:hypothetical protein